MTRREKAPDPSAYPPGFLEWAFWQIDLSITAPTVERQYAALLPKWRETHPERPGEGGATDGHGGHDRAGA